MSRSDSLTWVPLAKVHQMLPDMPGVYVVRQVSTGQEYVGISRNVRRRVMRHRVADSGTSLLHRKVRTHGHEDFEAAVLHLAAEDDLAHLEILAISDRRTICPHGFNLTSGGGKLHSAELSEERRAASAATARRTHLGAKRSEATKKRMAEAATGRKMSVEAVEASRLANIGKKMPATTRSAIRASRERPVLVWPPECMAPLEFASILAARTFMRRPHSSVMRMLQTGSTSQGFAVAYAK